MENLIGEEENKFDLLLVGDHDFDLFKQVRFNPHHEVWITPESLNNPDHSIETSHEMDQSTQLHEDTYFGRVQYNSAFNGKYYRKNFFSIGLTSCVIVYIGYLYKALHKPLSLKKD